LRDVWADLMRPCKDGGLRWNTLGSEPHALSELLNPFLNGGVPNCLRGMLGNISFTAAVARSLGARSTERLCQSAASPSESHVFHPLKARQHTRLNAAFGAMNLGVRTDPEARR
jgi:hypothetical protein